jgi:F420-non-reducing hydrogenase iron-sulfur subunit
VEDSARPLIVGFFCTWCAYRAADLVGTTRRPYAANLRPLRVVCTGRVAPELVLRTLTAGADGVLVVGCHPGECHRSDGNLKALRRLTLLRLALGQVGVDEKRVQLVWTAASEGPALAEAADRMTEELRLLGPLTRRTDVFGSLQPEARPLVRSGI